MKAREVRIGNCLLINGEPREIWAIGDIRDSWLDVDRDINDGTDNKFEGIQITEDWLVKFGFEYDESEEIYYLKTFQDGFQGEIDAIQIEVLITDEIGVYKDDKFICKINFVHQLQNLYFSLTGKELTYE